jgi:hypothetical protein
MDYSILKSRMFWTAVITFVVVGGNAIVPMLPPNVEAVVTGLLLLLATYFHINPSQTYNPPQA